MGLEVSELGIRVREVELEVNEEFKIFQDFNKLLNKILGMQPSPCFHSRLLLDLVPDASAKTCEEPLVPSYSAHCIPFWLWNTLISEDYIVQ